MTRSEELWKSLEIVPKDMPLHDGAEVAAIAQLMDECQTEQELQSLAGRIKNTELHELDREALRRVYKDCLRVIRIYGERNGDEFF